MGKDAKKRRKDDIIDQHRAMYGMPRRSNLIIATAKIAYPPLSFIPQRIDRRLHDEEIRIAIRLLTFLNSETLEANNGSIYGARIFEKAESILGISVSALYLLWEEWTDTRILPKSKIQPRIQKANSIVTRFSGEIRAFIIQRKQMHFP